MKHLFSLVIVLIFLNEAKAIDPWEGTRHLLSTKVAVTYYTKIEMSNNKGKVVTRDGASDIVVSENQGNGVLQISLTEDVTSRSFPFYSDPETGFSGQVLTTRQLKEITLSGHESRPTVIKNYRVCRHFPEGYERCESESQNLSKKNTLTLASDLPDRIVSFRPGDQVVLPFVGNHSIYVKLNADRTVTLLSQPPIVDDYLPLPLPEFNNLTWTLGGDMSELVIHFGNGYVARYKKLSPVEGTDRMIGTYSDESKESSAATVIGLAAKANPDLAFDEESAAGRYVALFSFNEPVTYEFNVNGWGGFDYSYQGIVPETTKWKWTLNSESEIEAKQFRVFEQFESGEVNAGPLINDRYELKSCQKSIVMGVPNCSVHIERTHRLLNKTGSRHIVLRTMKLYGWDASGELQVTHRVVNPMIWYKK